MSIDFKECLEWCKSHPLKLDYTPYSKYGVVRIKSPMRKWKVYFENDEIKEVTYMYREYNGSKLGGDYKVHYMAPKTSLMDLLQYINKNDYHIPKYELHDRDGIEEYAAQFGLDAEFTDSSVFLYAKMGRWRIDYEDGKVKNCYRLNTKKDDRGIPHNYWKKHKDAPKRNIAATIHYCYRKNKMMDAVINKGCGKKKYHIA